MADTEKELDLPKPSKMVYFKAAFLIVVLVAGMVVINTFAKQPRTEASEDTSSKTVEAVLGLKDRVLTDEQIQTIAQEVEEKGTVETINTAAEQVKVEASRAAEQVVDKTTETVMDYVYDKTLVQVIDKLIESLPERQRALYVERMCQ